MYAVVRTYSGAGAKELFTLLEQRKAEVEAVMRAVPGLVSYTLVRSAEDDGLCRDNPPVSQPGPRHTACGRSFLQRTGAVTLPRSAGISLVSRPD